jgi:hypothetical protein
MKTKHQPRKLPANIADLEWGRICDAQRVIAASRSTYYNWLEVGLVRGRRIGGARYIDMDSVRQLAENAPSKPPKAVSRQMTKRAFASADKRAANGKGMNI